MVSVCMATFNGEKYILQQINSILPQLNLGDELIISDDGSTDETVDIINNILDPRIKLIKSSKKNIVKNFESALVSAKGDIIFLSDQDDIWMPNKVEICKSYLIEYDLVFTNLAVFHDDIECTKLFYEVNNCKTGIVKNLIKNHYIGATMAFQRKVLTKALPFPNNIYMHDIWLALIAELHGNTAYIHQPLIYYRRHGNNASKTGEKSTNSLYKKITMRGNLIIALISRY